MQRVGRGGHGFKADEVPVEGCVDHSHREFGSDGDLNGALSVGDAEDGVARGVPLEARIDIVERKSFERRRPMEGRGLGFAGRNIFI